MAVPCLSVEALGALDRSHRGEFPSFLRAEYDVTTEQERAFRTNETETTDSAGKFRLRAICDPDRKAFIVTLKFYRT